MDRKLEDTKVAICRDMSLELKEVRSSSTTHSSKEGYTEISHDTKTQFHWKLCGIASKLGPEIVNSDDFDGKDQEVYEVEFKSHGFEHNFIGFKTREDAIRNVLEFAKRNGIAVDGYK